MKLKVGDTVRISENSQFFFGNGLRYIDENPQSIDEYGVIDTIIDGHLGIGVMWDAGYHNAYGERDLVRVTIFYKKFVNKLSLV